MSGDELNDLIEAIYDVVFDPGSMQTVLERMCALTGSESGVLGFHSDKGVEHDEVFGCDPQWRAAFCAFEHQNLYLQRRHMVPVGTAVLGAQLAPDEEVRRLDIYHEFHRPAGAVHLLGAVFLNKPCAFGEISLWRPEKRERHGSTELEIANLLARHLERAFRIARHMQAAWIKATQLEAALDHLAVACLLLDATGRLIHANAEAEAVLRSRAPLHVAQGRIVADGAANQRIWETLLRRLNRGDGPAEGTAAALETEERTPLRVVALPLTSPRSETLGLMPPSAPLGLVCIGSITPRPDRAVATLRKLFGLTPAQADLTVALFGGESLHEYAGRRGRSLNTVRTHLKEVFAKTGARRQADLVRQLTMLGMVVR